MKCGEINWQDIAGNEKEYERKVGAWQGKKRSTQVRAGRPDGMALWASTLLASERLTAESEARGNRKPTKKRIETKNH